MNALSLIARSPVIPVFALEDFVVLYVDARFSDRVLIKDGLPLVDVMRIGVPLGLIFTVELCGAEPRVVGWLPASPAAAA